MPDVRINIDSRVRVENGTKLDKVTISELKREFEHDNPEHGKKKRMGLPMWNEPRMIRTWKEEGGDLTFPRGGTSRVTKCLFDLGYSVDIKDSRQWSVEARIPNLIRPLYPFQADIVAKILEREQGIIRAPTGGGKTQVLLAVASAVQVPTLVVVHSQALLDQWHVRLVSELGLKPKQIGIVQGRKSNLRPITLTIQKTMANVAAGSKEIRDYFGCIIADEVHMFAASTFFACVDPFPARYRIGASADHRRKDRREFLIYDLFGDLVADVSRRELIDSGHILDVKICVLPTSFSADWYGLRDEEDKTDERQLDFVRLVQEMANDPLRNFEAFRHVRDEVKRGEQVLVMAHEREHCMRLGQMFTTERIKTGYLLGSTESAKEFASTLAGLKDGSIRVGVGTYKALGTGIDLPKVGVAVAVTPIAGNQQFFGQVRGRVCRTAKGKKGAKLYLLWDHAVYGKHLRNLMSWNSDVVVRNENGNWVEARHYVMETGT